MAQHGNGRNGNDRRSLTSSSGTHVRYIKKALLIAIPIMIQNGITNIVGMLDNVMVGRVGTDPMSGVAVVNEILFVWMLMIFGGLSGIGIFTAQYTGKGDTEGVRNTFRLQILVSLLITIAGIAVFLTRGEQLVSLFLTEDTGIGNAEATLSFAMSYFKVMCLGLVPFAVTQAYAGTLRSTGETVMPMTASLIAVAVNLVGNYILIYGKMGAPALGVVGAAAATVISRIVELLCLALWTHLHAEKYRFVKGVYRSFHVPAALIRSCAVKGMPLLLNETMWAGCSATLTQIYSVRGLSVIAAFNISRTISNVFNVAFIAMGSAIGIIIGQELGAGGKSAEEVKKDAWILTWFSVGLCVISGGLLTLVSGAFPLIYNTSDEIRAMAVGLIRISAVCMPLYAFENASYFVIRSGGKTVVTFFFDSCFGWIFSIPAAWFLVHRTGLPILTLFFIVQMIEWIKCVIGFVLMKKGIWINDITV